MFHTIYGLCFYYLLYFTYISNVYYIFYNFRLIFNLNTNYNNVNFILFTKLIKGVLVISLLNKKIKENDSKSQWEKIEINSWNPEVGDKLEGVLVKIDTNANQMIYIIETNDKKRVRIWGKTYLNQLMDEVELNDYLRITYNGIKQTKNNRNMKKYNLERRIKDD